jgi:subtilisin family serine protease
VPEVIKSCLAVAMLACLVAASPASAAANDHYVVMLKAAPLASYRGEVRGFGATNPGVAGTRKVDARSGAGRAYAGYLTRRQNAVLDRLPGKRPSAIYSYRTAFAGFAAKLTRAQAIAARKDPSVARVFRDELRQATAVNTGNPNQVDAALDGAGGDSAAYLGLPHGLWDTVGGPDQAGDGVVVGVIDTGISPEHPSFADDPTGGLYEGTPFAAPPASFTGACVVGTDITFQCNDKLVGARFFDEAFTDVAPLAADEIESPRDTAGHGSHTASSAAGNFGVDPVVGANNLGVNLISGLAPRARVAAYKVLWTGDGVTGGFTSDLVAGIDAAVADGVDVINYSIGSSGTTLVGPDAFAFLSASDAGVFVAVSASNDGPDPGTIGDPAGVPWVASAAASSTARTFTATATITPTAGAVLNITGASAGAGHAAAPLIDAAAAGKAGVAVADAELCLQDTLDPAKVTGKVVLCKRGAPSRIGASYEVAQAGGVGEILFNATQGDDLAAYPFHVPTIAVDADDGAAIKAALDAGTTAALGAGTASAHPAKVLAAFSSRGPSTATPDIAKPDLSAPGVDILGATSPVLTSEEGPTGLSFMVISGTSMASPHVAGAAALLKQRHATWSPAEIKSALMVTADPTVLKEDGVTAATAFDQGSGEIDPTAADDPGLILDATTDDYVSYLGTQDPTTVNGAVPELQPVDLNLPSIASSAVLNSISTVRTVKSTLAGPTNWAAAVSVPGFTTAVTGPGVSGGAFSLTGVGTTKALTITATRTSAPFDEYAYGALTLSAAGGRVLRIPISLRPVRIKTPDTVALSTDKPAGTSPLSVKTGFAGSLFGFGYGLAAPGAHPAQTVGTGDLDFGTANAANRFYEVTVPAGAQLLAGRITSAAPAASDLDLFLFRDANNDGAFTADEFYDQSATGAANEALTEFAPDPGKYRFVVNGFGTGNPSTFDMTTWTLADAKPDDASDKPGITVTGDPFSATLGGTVAPTLDYSGVDKKGLYLGVATYAATSTAAFGTADALGQSLIELTKTKDEVVATPTPSPSPSPTPSPTVTPTPKSAPVISISRTGKKARARFRVTCSTECKVTGRLTISKKLARKLHLKSRTIGTLTGNVARAGRRTFLLKVSAKAVRALRKAHALRVKGTLVVNAKDIQTPPRSKRVSRAVTIRLK